MCARVKAEIEQPVSHMRSAPTETDNISGALMDEVLYACACNDLFQDIAWDEMPLCH